jgi:hypothetical protein
MKVFHCQHCGQMVYFANTRCERCGHLLGYIPDLAILSALAPLGEERWHPLAARDRPSRFCANAAHDACNWLIPAESPDMYCRACRLNRTIPDLDTLENRLRWQRLESAKHRLVYGLLRLRLPLTNRFDDPEAGLAFDFLANTEEMAREQAQIVTGHATGLITIDIAEADDAERERHRQDMAESYRTLLGHFRHEVGHYYWDRLVRGGPWLSSFRDLFGDERQDYGASLARHYADGPLPTGGSASSAATPVPTLGRISRKPGRITCTSWTPWRRHTRSVYASVPKETPIPRLPWRSTSIPTVSGTSTFWSGHGCH